MERRTFVKLVLGSSAAALVGVELAGPGFSAALGLPDGPFQYGVASGDPLPNGFIIWTRVTPSPDATPGSGLGVATPVNWIVATDATLTNVVASGTVVTSPTTDHTVKVDVSGLAPSSAYYYGFVVGSTTSTIGRCKTAPAVDATNQRVRFGFVSCSNYAQGYFVPYRYLASRDDLDFVLHVGDYIYEYGDGGYGSFRPLDPPTEIISLADYRRRFAVYRSDEDLVALHARYPFITTLDDHETTNDAWAAGAQNHSDPAEGDYVTRRNVAYQAYFEWMPIRPSIVTPAETRFYRALRFGTLVDLTLLDLRQYRSKQVTTYSDALLPTQLMLGTDELTWLEAQLTKPSPASWQLIGNSVQIMQVRYPVPFGVADGTGTFRNVDAWDGYAAQRALLLQFIADNDTSWDAVFLTGDIHSTWASDLRVNFDAPATPSVATEFVSTSVTSDNLNEIVGMPPRSATSIGIENGLKAINPHIKLLEFDSHGCSIVDVTPLRVQTDWYYTSDRENPNATITHGFSKQTLFGEKKISTVDPAGPIVDDFEPPAEVPEAPYEVLLPVSAAVLIGGVIALRQRGERHVDAIG
jgi:alkaline phosphatase D